MKLHGCKKHGKKCYSEFNVSEYPMKQEMTKFLLISLKCLIFPFKHLYLLKAIQYETAVHTIFLMEFFC